MARRKTKKAETETKIETTEIKKELENENTTEDKISKSLEKIENKISNKDDDSKTSETPNQSSEDKSESTDIQSDTQTSETQTSETSSPKPQTTAKKLNKDEIDELTIKQYYKRYSDYIKARKPQKAITTFYNIYFVVEKNPKILFKTIELFKTNKNLLHEKVALQSIESLDTVKKLKLGIFYHVIRTIVYNEDRSKINFSLVKEVIPDNVFNEYKKVLKTS